MDAHRSHMKACAQCRDAWVIGGYIKDAVAASCRVGAGLVRERWSKGKLAAADAGTQD